MKGEKIYKILLEGIGLLLSLVVLVPVYFVVINSFKTPNEAADMMITWPSKFQIFENYRAVYVEGHILRALINSSIITGASVALIIIVASLTGYVLQRRKDRYTNFLNFMVLAGLIVPPAMVPTYWVLKLLHVNGTVLSVILMEAVLGFSFSVLIYKGFFTTIPREIDEAALVDGCGGLRLFYTIIFPLLKPVTTTIAVIQCISIWNDFNIPMYFLSSSSNTTLPITVFLFFGKYLSNWNLVFADVVIIAIPVTIVYLLAQKYIIDGMTAGSLKG